MTQPVRTPIPRLGASTGYPILAYGFRPFFLAAGLSAVLGLVLWLADLAGVMTLPSEFSPIVWHAHEMIFGFTTAAVAGFLLTAIPNWTGRLPLHGGPLLGLVLLWFAGRLAVATSALIGAWPAAVIDLAFLTVMLLVVLREISAGRNWRNLPMAVAVILLITANALMHAEVLGLAIANGIGWRLAIAVVTLLVGLIGGRIIPSFTRNWLAKRGTDEAALPVAFDRYDRLTLAVTAVALAIWIFLPGTIVAGAATALAAALNFVRLSRWRGEQTFADPLVLVLHLGFVWVPIGLALLAASQITTLLPESVAVHGLTVGAFGTMILAVMTRATLGHTGRALRASAGTTASYALVTVAAVARIVAAFWPAAYDVLISISGLAWIAAFAVFVAIYGPILLRPRIDGRPG